MDRSRLISLLALGTLLIATSVRAQDRRGIVFGDVGYGTIGYADSQQGRAPFIGGGIGFQLTPHFGVEADVHTGRVAHVFGRERHDFSEVTLTGSLVFRGPVGDKAHFIVGGGVAMQRAHTEINEPPIPPIDRVETLRLLHGKIGVDWDVSRRVVVRTHAVLWMGGGLDWVVGGRVGVGYRF